MKTTISLSLLVALCAVGQVAAQGAQSFRQELTYDQHTLPDSVFQWDKMRARVAMLDSIQLGEPSQWALIRNRKNEHGQAPLVKNWRNDEYRTAADRNGVERYQSVPLYAAEGDIAGGVAPELYGRDGSLVKLLGMDADSTLYRLECYNTRGVWHVPAKYVKHLSRDVEFTRAVMVDRGRQNIATLEKTEGGEWVVRSRTLCTTGLHNPPYGRSTPVGMFVVQEKLAKMFYTGDGNATIVGYAPWASRFTNGAYLHGVPVNSPNGAIIEFSATLGTTPRSHECVRNAASHARFLYDWATTDEAIVFVFE